MGEIDAIGLLVFDVDGVLTDGGILVSDTGLEHKRFHVRDGLAMRAAQRVGLKVGMLSGRSTRAVALRATELRVDALVQGSRDKAKDLAAMCRELDLEPEQSGYLGDDLVDLPALAACGYPMAVQDAVPEVRSRARFVTQAPGGHGAAREAIEHVLKAQGKWAEVLARYEA